MNKGETYDNDTITKIFKLLIPKEQHSRYIKFAKSINDYLKKNYNKYFICNILLQDKDDNRIIYSVELYNNILNEDYIFKTLYEEIEKMYDEEFGKEIERREVKDDSEIKRILSE